MIEKDIISLEKEKLGESKSLAEKLLIPVTLVALIGLYIVSNKVNKAEELKQQEILNHPKSTIECYVKNEAEFIETSKKYSSKGISWEKKSLKDLELNGLSAVCISEGKYRFYVYEK